MARRKDPDAQLVADYKFVFNSKEGQRVLADFREWAGRNPFDINAMVMSFNCGKAGMVEMIDKFLEAE